ncbi:MAG TPA: FmdE family protein [Gaiellaceae bacterium]|nr:FmdE family protein [Gaiellaceae bacterium]
MSEQAQASEAITPETVERIVDFHGHMCPGLALGIQAARIALREIGAHAQDEEVVATVETDMCAVDAIQFLTGCTFGKGNLVHRDLGKNAYTFWRRSDGKAIRVSGKPGVRRRDPEHQDLFEKLGSGNATPVERDRLWELHHERSAVILAMQPEELFTVVPVDDAPPRKARVHVSVECESCREETMETRVRLLRGKRLCPDCFDWELSAS